MTWLALCSVFSYLCSVLDQLHPAVFQVDETDPHPPQQLQVFRVVGHEVLSPQWRTSHPRLPERKEFQSVNTHLLEMGNNKLLFATADKQDVPGCVGPTSVQRGSAKIHIFICSYGCNSGFIL